MTSQAEFLAEVAVFLIESRMKPNRFGRAAMGDPGFVAELGKGRAPNLRTIERARAFIKTHSSMAVKS